VLELAVFAAAGRCGRFAVGMQGQTRWRDCRQRGGGHCEDHGAIRMHTHTPRQLHRCMPFIFPPCTLS
jgi:hypothetical protein